MNDNYKELSKMFYIVDDIDKEVKKRIDNPCTYETNLSIQPILKGKRDTKKSYNIFYLPIKDILLLQEKIFLNSDKIKELSLKLPMIAKESCTREIMTNEIIKSNNIEGVHTTKKDVYHSLTSKKTTRLTGIINKYKQIINNNIDKITTPEEITKLYTDIFKDDILKNDENKIDGILFRKKPIHISDGFKYIHSGEPNEETITKHITDLIEFMNKKDINSLVKACITHYYLEYVHPFYDGNGRFGRLLFSMYLAKKLDVFTGLSLSYAIFQEKEKYYKLFSKVSELKNYGEITFFIVGMLDTISKGQENIIELLNNKILKLNYARNYIKTLSLNNIESSILYIYIQDFIFSDMENLKDLELLEILKDKKIKSRLTLNKYLKNLVDKNILLKVSNNPSYHILTDNIKEKI